ncbi:replication protein [Rhodobacteraceae bacterium CCMM004]|nr:replication protein [Rhodobacteraceae bacterium CCMM004]
MAKKRRVFEIDMPAPDAAPDETFPAGKVEGRARRGPMASAITETAESARARTAVEAQIRAENDALAHEHVRLRAEGRVVDLVPLDLIDTTKLVRDRSPGPDPELAELVESIRTMGLSNPIRVERAGERYELIQGFRRLGAYRALLAETGDADAWGGIPAAVAEPGEGLDSLYRRMVDENLVRKDISFAEMALLAQDYAADPETHEMDVDKAVAHLFRSAGYQKRSYIRAFARLMHWLRRDLRHPTAIPRSLGLNLVAAIEETPEVVGRIQGDLAEWPERSVADELTVLRRHAGEDPPAPAAAPAKKPRTARARTSFEVAHGGQRAKCTASAGRLEIRADRDFSTVDRQKLEAGIEALLRSLG